MNALQSRSTTGLAFAAVSAVLIVLAFAGAAGAEKPITVVVPGNLYPMLSGSFSPKTLSKTELTPIALTVSGRFKTTDGGLPPALTELNVKADRNGAVEVRGLPVCSPTSLRHKTEQVREGCKSAIVGSGSVDIIVAFPESTPIPIKSELIIFNGGARKGVTTLYAHAYISVPAPKALVATIKIKTIHQGRFGTESAITVPTIATGHGAVTSFNATIHRDLPRKNKRVNPLSLKCPDGKIVAEGKALFSDGTEGRERFVRPCLQGE
jgi:hypothetical protein